LTWHQLSRTPNGILAQPSQFLESRYTHTGFPFSWLKDSYSWLKLVSWVISHITSIFVMYHAYSHIYYTASSLATPVTTTHCFSSSRDSKKTTVVGYCSITINGSLCIMVTFGPFWHGITHHSTFTVWVSCSTRSGPTGLVNCNCF
jgi:hypothetical protein